MRSLILIFLLSSASMFSQSAFADDMDSDGVDDIIDNCPLIANTDQVDFDNDSLGDVCDSDIDGDSVVNGDDAFPNDPSEIADTDADAVGDNADAFPNDATETADTDGDGVGDNADAFPNDSSETVDSDYDGIGDNADALPNDPSGSVDIDSDSVGDNADNCPVDVNTDQMDTDSDGIGDACDADDDNDNVLDVNDDFPLNALLAADPDSDGVDSGNAKYQIQDNCPTVANADQLDTDNNGIGDACDSTPNPDIPAVITGDTNAIIDLNDVIFGSLIAEDVNGLTDGTYFSITSPPANGQAFIDAATGTWFYISDASYIGIDPFTVTVTDDLAGTTEQIISITVTGIDTDGDTIYDPSDNCPSVLMLTKPTLITMHSAMLVTLI